MFNFLNSGVLFAALAALIPLLIHLFSKRRVKIVEFSSLKHLKEMQRRQVRRLKIRQILLLLLRMAIILALVLAFARPTTEGGALGSHAAVSAVVLFDNSASMDRSVRDGNLFALAKQRTQKLLETFGESDEVALVPLCRTAAAEGAGRFGSAAAAQQELAQVPASALRADFAGALGRASDLIAQASNLTREIYIVSDRQRASLPDSGLKLEGKVQVFVVALPDEDAENVGVAGVDFGGQLLVPEHDFEVVAQVHNYGAAARTDLIASLYLDGRRVAQTDAAAPAGGDEAVRFTQSVARGGFHSGWVELSDDRFPSDNRYYFTFRIPEQFTVLMVAGDPAAQFISLALTPSGDLAQYWSVKQARPEDLGTVDLAEYDVIMLPGTPAIADAYVGRIKAAVRRGTSLFLTYGGGADAASFNRTWADIAGVVIDEAARTDFSRAGYYTLESVVKEHPIFSVFSFAEKLPDLKFYTLPRLHTVGEAAEIATFSGGRPALVEARYGEGRVVTFAGPMAPAYSDMVGHAFFVPFVSRVAEYLAADLSSYDLKLYARASTPRVISLRGAISGSLELIAPDSSRYYLSPEESEGRVLVRAQPVERPGIYQVRYAGQEVDRFAVNIDPAEGDLAAADVDRFAQAVGAPEHRELAAEGNLAGLIAESRYGRELWQLFLWIAAGLLLAEMLLARGAPPEEPG
ncbi:MAG TPA: BatA domain-containing protein [candidate division Zixibacteria bacterium]|nr:BatA domain-containing protein [candidate division Zixibacteria bacterium]MDD4918291.1 BatA domain-containing protein [candidate division Zixibacteria bacterium]MDM7973190.1 BatA domain-containing protein [candidate division Zixibacteria bacterium]HPM38374.1 BatA domain-containing protein [candidate division Zixibacteria bacterium]